MLCNCVRDRGKGGQVSPMFSTVFGDVDCTSSQRVKRRIIVAAHQLLVLSHPPLFSSLGEEKNPRCFNSSSENPDIESCHLSRAERNRSNKTSNILKSSLGTTLPRDSYIQAHNTCSKISVFNGTVF